MEFEINIFVYIIFSLIEMNVISNLANQMTSVKADKKKELIVVAISAMVIILLDIFVYDFTKTGMRSMSSLVVIYILLKLTKKISFTKAGIQLLVVMVAIIIGDIVVQIIGRLTFTTPLSEGINFTYMYGILLIVLNLAWFIMRRFNLSVLNLNKSKL